MVSSPSSAPHDPQNLKPSGFSRPQLAQRVMPESLRGAHAGVKLRAQASSKWLEPHRPSSYHGSGASVPPYDEPLTEIDVSSAEPRALPIGQGGFSVQHQGGTLARSEERRVGKERKPRWQ